MPSNAPKSENRAPASREKGDPLCEFCRPATINLPHLVRAARRLAISEMRAAGEWLQIKYVFEAVIKKQKARFDAARRASIEITVFRNIVSDSAEGCLGTEQSPALMLLSDDYFKIDLVPSALAEFLHTFDDLSGDNKDRAIINFLKDHCWIRSTVAALWLGKDIPLPRPVRSPQEPASMPAIGRCQKWLISKREDKRKSESFDAYRDEAKKEFGVGPHQFRKLVWDEVIPKDHPWRKQGRPRKKS
jgi:hypothetical protein